MKRSVVLAILFLLLVLLPMPASAANGIGVAPGLQEVVLDENEEQESFEVTVSNSTESRVDFRLSTIDFGALDESGGVAFLGRTGQETYSYALSKWMELDKTEISVEPGKTEVVQVTIRNANDLSPGGHYGAVLVTSRQDGQVRNDSVATLPGASTLVLLRKTGGESYDLKIDSIKTNSSLIRVPESAGLRFENKGNVHVVPRGTVMLSDPFNTVIARGVINESSGFTLPESYRMYEVPLRFSQQPWLPGRYTLTTTWRYDGTEDVKVVESHHWYLGRIGIGVLGVLSLAIVLYLFILYRRRPITRN